ncbi:glycosyl hydrolase family 18 [bacterium]|nr:MAG: glycosyl hydrolase family 18 [bacterium]
MNSLFIFKAAAFAATALLLSCVDAGSTPGENAKPQARKFVVAYVPNWIELEAFVQTIEFKKVTHINIAFENPTDADGTMSFDPKEQKLIDMAKENGVKILVSIGGGSAADDPVLKPRYFDLISKDKRAMFAGKLAKYVEDHGLDGLDVDLEGPSINEDYGAFIDELSKALKPKGKLLTSALSQGYGGDRVPKSAFDKFDFVNVMAYDGTGPWGKDRPGQHSSMEYAKSNVKFWLDRGLPKSKTVLGVPFYGYGFGDAFRSYGYDYKEILEKFPGAENSDQVGTTIWYNGVPTMRAKAQYAIDEGLLGVMIWSLDEDVPGPRSLLGALHETLNP